MKPISNDFKNALKKIKQIDAIISYADRENTNYIITQNSEFLLTEAQDFLVTESAEVVIDNGGIQNCSIYWNTDVFKSVCKMLDLETSTSIQKGTEINVRIGLKVGNSYEYVDYGKFYVNEDAQYNLDTGTYSTTCYDKMICFNIKASENPLTFEEGTTYTLKQYLEMICDKCGVLYSFDFSNVINDGAQIIDGDPYLGNKEVTYRDILDDIAECLGTNFIINANNRIANKEILLMNNITIDADIIRDTNVYVGEKKDPIDGIQVYNGSTMINYAGDDTSVLKIRNNNIMSAHSTDLIEGVLSMIRDFYYYTYKLETFGVLALEPFDCFTVSYNNTNYLLCSFHNEIDITTGISEEISYEFSEEDNVNEYTTASSEDKSRDASIEIDKAKGQVVLKANSNGNIVEASLSADADDGSAFNVKADNINFNGKTFNLTADNMAITSTNFSIDKNGNITANSGTFGGTINTSQDCTVGNNLYIGQNQSASDIDIKYIYLDNEQYIKRFISNTAGFINLQAKTSVNIDAGTNPKSNLTIAEDYINMYLNGSSEIYVENGYIRFARQPVISSDQKLKNKIKNINVSWIDELKVKEYEYKNNENNKQIGLIAQDYIDKEYAKYFLEKDKNGIYGIQYGNITNALIQYCQELKKEVQELKNEIKSLKGDDN